jgi:hypothetical protein
LAIGALSITAVILFSALMLLDARPAPALAGGMTASGGDYTATVGQFTSGDEELLYVVDNPAQKMGIYRFDSGKKQIDLVDLIDLDAMRKSAAQPPKSRGG